jgi:hypothetical protein
MNEVDSYNQNVQKKQIESEVNPRNRRSKHDDDFGTFKIGGENREIKKRTYDDYTNSLVLNPTRETGAITQQQTSYSIRGKSNQRNNFNIINHTQSDYYNQNNKPEVSYERNIHSNPINNYNPRVENNPRDSGKYRQVNELNAREIPNNIQPGNFENQNPYNVKNNYNYPPSNNEYINHMNHYDPNSYEGKGNQENTHLENFNNHYELNQNRGKTPKQEPTENYERQMSQDPEISEEQYQKYYQEYLNSIREQNTKELFDKNNQPNLYEKPVDVPYGENYNELAYEMGKMNIGKENPTPTHQQNEYQYNKNNQMKGNNIHNIPDKGEFQSNEKVDHQKNYRDYLDSQVKTY